MNNKAVITKLVVVYKSDSLVLEMISDTLKSFTKYIDIIQEQEVTVLVDKSNMTSEDFRERMMLLDRNRRIVHNSIISGVKTINRLCREKDIPLFYELDENDRVKIADFAFNIVEENFKNRKK